MDRITKLNILINNDLQYLSVQMDALYVQTNNCKLRI